MGKWVFDNISWAASVWILSKTWKRVGPERRGTILFLASSAAFMGVLAAPAVVGMWYLGLPGFVFGIYPYLIAMLWKVRGGGRVGRNVLGWVLQRLSDRFLARSSYSAQVRLLNTEDETRSPRIG